MNAVIEGLNLKLVARNEISGTSFDSQSIDFSLKFGVLVLKNLDGSRMSIRIVDSCLQFPEGQNLISKSAEFDVFFSNEALDSEVIDLKISKVSCCFDSA